MYIVKKNVLPYSESGTSEDVKVSSADRERKEYNHRWRVCIGNSSCAWLRVQELGVWTGVLKVSGVTGVEGSHSLGQEAVE